MLKIKGNAKDDSSEDEDGNFNRIKRKRMSFSSDSERSSTDIQKPKAAKADNATRKQEEMQTRNGENAAVSVSLNANAEGSKNTNALPNLSKKLKPQEYDEDLFELQQTGSNVNSPKHSHIKLVTSPSKKSIPATIHTSKNVESSDLESECNEAHLVKLEMRSEPMDSDDEPLRKPVISKPHIKPFRHRHRKHHGSSSDSDVERQGLHSKNKAKSNENSRTGQRKKLRKKYSSKSPSAVDSTEDLHGKHKGAQSDSDGKIFPGKRDSKSGKVLSKASDSGDSYNTDSDDESDDDEPLKKRFTTRRHSFKKSTSKRKIEDSDNGIISDNGLIGKQKLKTPGSNSDDADLKHKSPISKPRRLSLKKTVSKREVQDNGSESEKDLAKKHKTKLLESDSDDAAVRSKSPISKSRRLSLKMSVSKRAVEDSASDDKSDKEQSKKQKLKTPESDSDGNSFRKKSPISKSRRVSLKVSRSKRDVQESDSDEKNFVELSKSLKSYQMQSDSSDENEPLKRKSPASKSRRPSLKKSVSKREILDSDSEDKESSAKQKSKPQENVEDNDAHKKKSPISRSRKSSLKKRPGKRRDSNSDYESESDSTDISAESKQQIDGNENKLSKKTDAAPKSQIGLRNIKKLASETSSYSDDESTEEFRSKPKPSSLPNDQNVEDVPINTAIDRDAASSKLRTKEHVYGRRSESSGDSEKESKEVANASKVKSDSDSDSKPLKLVQSGGKNDSKARKPTTEQCDDSESGDETLSTIKKQQTERSSGDEDSSESISADNAQHKTKSTTNNNSTTKSRKGANHRQSAQATKTLDSSDGSSDDANTPVTKLKKGSFKLEVNGNSDDHSSAIEDVKVTKRKRAGGSDGDMSDSGSYGLSLVSSNKSKELSKSSRNEKRNKGLEKRVMHFGNSDDGTDSEDDDIPLHKLKSKIPKEIGDDGDIKNMSVTKIKRESDDSSSDSGPDDLLPISANRSDESSKSSRKKEPSKKKANSELPKKKNSPKESATERKIALLKHYLTLCGLHHFSYAKMLKDCKTQKSQIAKLTELLEDTGMKGRPTVKKCQRLKRKIEDKKEFEELDLSNILDTAQGRSHRNARSLYKRAPSCVETKPTVEMNGSKKVFSRLKGIVDSDDSSN